MRHGRGAVFVSTGSTGDEEMKKSRETQAMIIMSKTGNGSGREMTFYWSQRSSNHICGNHLECLRGVKTVILDGSVAVSCQHLPLNGALRHQSILSTPLESHRCGQNDCESTSKQFLSVQMFTYRYASTPKHVLRISVGALENAFLFFF